MEDVKESEALTESMSVDIQPKEESEKIVDIYIRVKEKEVIEI